MKKILFLLFLAISLVLVSCDNFMNGSGIQDQLDQMIDRANAESFTLVVSNDTTMGSFLSSGDKTCQVGYTIEVQFNVKKDLYVYKGLKAVSKSDDTKSMGDYVEFSAIDRDDARGIYKTSIKLLSGSNDILIVPECEPVPNIIEMTPDYNYEGEQQDTTISLKFNKPVTSTGEIEYLKTAITITDLDGESLAQYFGNPYFSADSTILYIPTVKTQRLLTDVDAKKDIVVKFDLSGIKDESGNVGNGFYQNKYRVNGTLDSIKPTLSSIEVYSAQDKTKQLLTTPFADWPDSSADKTNYIKNHVKGSVYVEIEGSDIGSGVARARVIEKLIKYSDGSAASTQAMESAVEFIEQSDDGKYCIVYDMKNTMDGIVELTFSLEDFAGNLNKTSDAKKVYVLKDTLVESGLVHFDQELAQIEVSETSWLSVIPVVEGDTQNVKFTTSTDYTDTFYPNCTSDYTIEAFWGYSKDAITNPVTVDKKKGEYTFTRDVSKFVYIKFIVSDEIGNTSEIIKYMDPRPVFNSVNTQNLQDPQSNVALSLKGLDSIKLLANKKIAGGGGKSGEREDSSYTQFIAYIYDSVDENGKPVGEPTKKMHFDSSYNDVTFTEEISTGGNNLTIWRDIRNFTGYENEIPFNKLIRIYAVSLCGDFISPITDNYVEYMISSMESYYPVYVEGKAPRLSDASDSSDINTKDILYEYGPYIKNTIKIKTDKIPNAGMYKITIDDYKTDAAIAEGNVQYQFKVYGRWPHFSSEEEAQNTPVTDDICTSGMDYTYDEPEFYLPAINYYKFYIVASGNRGTYMSIDMEDHDLLPSIGDEPGISFYLNDATTSIKLLGFSEDINPPNVMTDFRYSDPFGLNSEPGSVKIGIASDDTGLYKNAKGNYELTYYLIPATGSTLQTNKTYNLEELEKNYSRYKRTIEYSLSSNPNNESMSIPMGNEKGGVYNLVVVYEDEYHNANVVTYPSVNRLIGDLTFTQSDTQIVIESGNNNYNQGQQGGEPIQQGDNPIQQEGEPIQEGDNPNQQGGGSTSVYTCQQLSFTLGENDYVKIYRAGHMGLNHKWESIWSSAQSEDNTYLGWDEYGQTQNSQGAPLKDAWLKICGYKKTDSAFEMGFYNTQYYYLTDISWITCNSKNAITGLNGIQIFFDNPILAHTMFFKDYIPDDIDKNNYNDWERRGAETGVLFAKPSTKVINQFNSNGTVCGTTEETVPTTATYSFKENYAGVPSGCYYTTIIHFADGDVIMSDIKYKE